MDDAATKPEVLSFATTSRSPTRKSTRMCRAKSVKDRYIIIGMAQGVGFEPTTASLGSEGLLAVPRRMPDCGHPMRLGGK